MEMIEHVYDYGYDLQHFCRELLQYFRSLILIKVSQHPEKLIELPEEELKILKKQAEQFHLNQLSHLFNLLLKGEAEMAQSNFPRTMLEMTLIRTTTFPPILSIDEIIKKLDELAKGQSLRRSMEETALLPSEKNQITQPIKRGGGKGEFQKSQEEGPEEKLFEKEEFPKLRDENINPQASEKPADLDNFQKKGMAEGEPQKVYEEIWKGLIDFTRAKNPILGSFLVLGDLVLLSDERIEIGFEKDSFHYERMLEKGNRSQLESICQEYLQKKTKVFISPLDQGVRSKGPTVLESEGVTRKPLEERLEKGGEENPLVQEALRLFNGRIVER
jgi:DNA polymerase-3 subunit gamma/tau